MNAIDLLIGSISGNSKGHWGLVEPASSPISPASVSLIKGASSVFYTQLTAIDLETLTDESNSGSIKVAELELYLSSMIADCVSQGNRTLRILISCFDRLSLESQCSVVVQTRGVRESNTLLAIQVILHGCWNIFRFQDHWRLHLSSASPAPDRKHVYFKEEVSLKDLMHQLHGVGYISLTPTRIEQISADVLLELTGGDLFLVNYVLDAMRAQGATITDIESILDQIDSDGSIRDAVASRLSMIRPAAWDIIHSLLGHQYTKRPFQCADSEDLRLLGIVKVRRVASIWILAISSPVMERVLRRHWSHFAPDRGRVYNGLDLARPIFALNAAAYQFVFEIENTLRNLIVLTLEEVNQGTWQDQIKSIRAGTRMDDNGEEDVAVLFKQILEEIKGLSPSPSPEDAGFQAPAPAVAKEEKPPTSKTKNINVVESAEDWRGRQLKSPALELSHASLIYFFTSENIVKSFLSKPLYPDVWAKHFPQKHEFTTLMEYYVTIRSAVAHNQPVNLKTVSRLQMIQDDLQKMICAGFASE